MMRMNHIKMTTRGDRRKLLDTLKANLETHAKVVAEARQGYVQKAAKALEDRLLQLQLGRRVSLAFSLQPPADYSEVYKNSIEMLEWGTEETVELAADEFRQMVRDEWDWTDSFLLSNSVYSDIATALACSKGLS